ncbi:hypothetical protein D3C72_1273520 [compost metagenome]
MRDQPTAALQPVARLTPPYQPADESAAPGPFAAAWQQWCLAAADLPLPARDPAAAPSAARPANPQAPRLAGRRPALRPGDRHAGAIHRVSCMLQRALCTRRLPMCPGPAPIHTPFADRVPIAAAATQRPAQCPKAMPEAATPQKTQLRPARKSVETVTRCLAWCHARHHRGRVPEGQVPERTNGRHS